MRAAPGTAPITARRRGALTSEGIGCFLGQVETRTRPSLPPGAVAGVAAPRTVRRSRIRRMNHWRRLVALALILVTGGSLLASGGYAWYLRSGMYRRHCAARLSGELGLSSDIGRVIPRSHTTRQFDNVTVWLPDRRDRALFCAQALVVRTPSPAEPRAYEIHLAGGSSEISTRTWLREDYRRVLESGLRPGFAPHGPERVIFTGMHLQFVRDGFHIELADAAGAVYFESPQVGRVAVRCAALNGHQAAEPIGLAGQFSPQPHGIQIDELTLRIPPLPLAVLHPENLLHAPLRSGTFEGRVAYQERDGVRRTTLSGTCAQLDLAECTTGLLPRPWRGRGEPIALRELQLVDGRLTRLSFAGVVSGIDLGDVMCLLGWDDVSGKLELRVRDAELSVDGIERLVAAGAGWDIELEPLSARLGWGRLSGTARVTIQDLTIEDNRVRSLDAEARVESGGSQHWLEGRLLTEALGRLLHVNVPPMLPERIDYTDFGVRFEVRDELLYVFGTHGPREKTILTVRLLEREVPIVSEPEEPIDLTGPLDLWRAQAAAAMAQIQQVDSRQAWRRFAAWSQDHAVGGPISNPTSAPATGPADAGGD